MTATDSAAETPDTAAPVPDTAARLHLVIAALFLAAGALLYLAAAAKLVWPGFLEGAAATSYGRILPAATNALLYGWMTLALVGAAYYVVPRVAGRSLAARPLALASLVLMGGGVAAGITAVVTGGHNAGGRYLELPLWADAIVAVGALAAATVLTATARGGDREAAPLPLWYLVGGSWWLVLSWVIGAVPDSSGLPTAIQGWFAVTALSGLWLAAAGIGVGYYLVSRLVPGVEFHPRLGRIGFWSLAFAWTWTAGRTLQYGPGPDWAETVPVVFSAGLVVAAFTIAADLVLALRGRWQAVRDSVPLRFFAAGTALFLIVPLQMFVSSLRSASAVVHLTAWESAFEQLLLFGPFTFWALAAVYHVLPAAAGKAWGRRPGTVHLWLAAAGLAASLFSRWLAGLQQGYTWIGAVQSGDVANGGDGFRASVAALDGLQVVQVIGLGVFAVALIPFLAGVARHAIGRSRPDAEGRDVDMPVAPLRVVLRGAVALFLVSAVAVALAPASEADDGPSLLAEATRSHPEGSPEARGAELYLSEGCWYCHTQQVRPIVTDVGLGPVSTPGDYAYDDFDVLGIERIGPDLAHAGSRPPTDDRTWNLEHLRDPRAIRSWSTMPSYAYLSERDLADLAAYVAALD